MTLNLSSTIKIILAILFFLCLAEMPYGFYQLVRMAGLIGFAILAYDANQRKQPIVMIVYIGLALLFQPLFKVALGRDLWNIVDVLVGIGLLVSVYSEKRKTLKEQ
ncbi:MAG TPA: DUF6804 family protein [Chitinophagales bacterium]|nr:DUF6804 family protein [Chitinophagales bacterium]